MFIRWKRFLKVEGEYGSPRVVVRYSALLVRSVRVDGKPRQEQHYIASYTEYEPDREYRQWKVDEWERNRRFWDHAYTRLHKLGAHSCKQWPEIVRKLSERVPVTPPNYLD